MQLVHAREAGFRQRRQHGLGVTPRRVEADVAPMLTQALTAHSWITGNVIEEGCIAS